MIMVETTNALRSPIKFHPILRHKIWGGDAVCRFKHLPPLPEPVGESWEISPIPGVVTAVDGGAFDGIPLTELVGRFGEDLLGRRSVRKYGLVFPLLIKFIDARDNLSVQVHPDDRIARERHHSLGKAEMWYVIAHKPEAVIYSGLNRPLTPEDYQAHVYAGTFMDDVRAWKARTGQIYFLPPGRVHAIGSGVFLVEIQEASDITYRIYDYKRRDAEGHERELHTELAKDTIDYTYTPDDPYVHMSSDAEFENLVKCDHFFSDKVEVDGSYTLHTDGASFRVLVCVKGETEVSCIPGAPAVILKEGETALIPAVNTEIFFKGKATLISSGV